MNREDVRTQGEKLDAQLNCVALETIDATREVHRRFGPNFFESV